jgi:hypothetical protein
MSKLEDIDKLFHADGRCMCTAVQLISLIMRDLFLKIENDAAEYKCPTEMLVIINKIYVESVKLKCLIEKEKLNVMEEYFLAMQNRSNEDAEIRKGDK